MSVIDNGARSEDNSWHSATPMAYSLTIILPVPLRRQRYLRKVAVKSLHNLSRVRNTILLTCYLPKANMRPQRIGLIALLTVLATLAIDNFQLIQNPKSNIQHSQVLAQTPDTRKAEADRLNEQGIQQAQTGQVEAALQSFQQALIIYREIKDRNGEGQSLESLGNAYSSLRDYTKAIEYHQQSLAIRREINDRQGEGRSLTNLAQAYESLEDYAKAIEYHQQALLISRSLEKRDWQATDLTNLGNAYSSLRDYTKAIEYHQQSLAIRRKINDRQGEGKSLTNLAQAYESLEDYAKAIEYHQQALLISRSLEKRDWQATDLTNLGNAYSSLRDYTKAIEYHQQSLAIRREINDRQGEGRSLTNLAQAYESLSDYAKAIEYHQQALLISRSLEKRDWQVTDLNNLGWAYYSLDDYSKAIEYYQQSLAIAREIKDRNGEGNALGNLGIAYDSLGDYTKAIEYHQERLAIAREIKDRLGEGQSLGNLGLAYDSLGDYTKAIEYHQQSLAIAREIKDRKGEGQSLGNLGLAYYSLGDYTKAIDYQQQRLAIAREIKDRNGEGNALGNLGLAYYSLGDYTKAIDYHQQSLALAREIKDRKGEGQSLGNLGIAYDSLGDYTKAIDYHQQTLAIAREIKDRNSEGQSLGNLGLAYDSLGDYTKAIEYHQQRLAITQEIGDKDGEGLALNNLGLALHKSGNLPEAEKILRTGINVWEFQRGRLGENDAYKVSIFEEQARTYRILQKVLIAQNQPLPALEIAERGRARAFVELLARRNATTNDSANSPIAPPTIERLQQIAKQQNATLVEYSIIYDDFKVKGKEETHDSELYIWVIKPTGEITFRSSDLKPLWQKQDTTLADLVFTSRDLIGVRNLPIVGIVPRPGAVQKQEASLTEQLQQLHKLLIEPISDLLPTDPNAHVVFIPQGQLFLAPFPALKDKDGKYLIEKHTILTAPSIQVLQLTREQRQRVGAQDLAPLQGNDAIVVGNPTMPSVPPEPGQPAQPLPSLPGSEQEANAIAPLLKTKPLIGNQATKSAIKQLMPKARIIHLATHGLLDDVRGLGSAIALAPDSSYKEEVGKVNGLLTAEEILDLKLNAELVVLSACNTGRGRITGDGIIGLSRSLISAGVPSVLVSLWAVPDAPTASLMTDFYQNLQKNPDKAQALRQAMLTTLKQHPNPKNWAAFTLIGESE
ncbi:MAG TPA: CHAT domain-containing tetratricopeptide repeat protein [Coleofasciculaceae cyanobacterium]